ncbi:putative small nuclear ribonucleoprotein E, partial [Toxoplasma gondii TgCatPRC2]
MSGGVMSNKKLQKIMTQPI